MYNQQQPSERKLKKEKEKLENQKIQLETTKEVKDYLTWLKYSALGKAMIIKKWKEYYEKVKTTDAYKEYFEMRIHWKKRNIKKVKELVIKARKRLESSKSLSKPKETDPWEFSHGIYHKYDNICNQIKYINRQLTGIGDVEDIFSGENEK